VRAEFIEIELDTVRLSRRYRVSRLALVFAVMLIAAIFIFGPRVMMWLFGIPD
jgi:hypothetical protein